MINDPAQQSQTRQPRGIVRITGTEEINTVDASGNATTETVTHSPRNMPWLDWDVDNNVFYQADTFRVSFAVSDLPVDRAPDWFAAQSKITVEIYAGFPANPDSFDTSELKLWIVGDADECSYDPVSRVIELHGRDLTAKLIDSVTTEKFQNLTASAIARQIAARHGLNFVGQDTTTKVGDYYQIEHAALNNQESEWKMLNWLAGLERFVVYVAGYDLHFEPAPSASSDPYVIQWQQIDGGRYDSNVIRLSFSRNMALSKGIKVEVISFNQKTGKRVNVTYPAKARKDAQLYTRRYANLTNEQALQLAQSIYQEIIQHEMNLAADMPADNVLTMANVVKVQGTGTGYDQIYYPSSIRRSMSMDGYRMTVHAKNHSPENQ